MQILIDIPDSSYKVCYDLRNVGDVNCLADILVNAVGVGTPIPDNATNGDVIKAMFIDVKVNVTKYSYVVEVKLPHHTEHDTGLLFDKDWWNAPYQKEDKNE